MEQVARLDKRRNPLDLKIWLGRPMGRERPPEPRAAMPAAFAETLQTILDGFEEQLCVVAPDGTIVLSNEAWQRIVAFAGYDGLALNGNYHNFVADLAANGNEQAAAILAGIEEIHAGKRSSFTHRYDGTGRMLGRSFSIMLTAFGFAGEDFLLVSRSETTEVLELRRQRRSLGHQLLQVQDEERRRIARELHDSTSQLLVGLQLNLMRLKRFRSDSEIKTAADDCLKIVDSLHAELRAASFLAHPPALDHHGLSHAIDELAIGFATRTGLQIEMVVEEISKLPKLFETTLYRLTQEALTNVHRHAQAKHVWILLSQNRRRVYLEVRDDGIGMRLPPGLSTLGVGISGMRERIAELGGRLSIRSSSAGTRLIASIPWEQAPPEEA